MLTPAFGADQWERQGVAGEPADIARLEGMGIEFTAEGPAFPVIMIERSTPQEVLRELSALTGRMPFWNGPSPLRARSRITATDATVCGTLRPAACSAWPTKMPHQGAPW